MPRLKLLQLSDSNMEKSHIHYTRVKQNQAAHAQNAQIHPAHAQSYSGIYSQLIPSIMSNDSFSGE